MKATKLRRAVVVLAIGGMTFAGLFGGVFNPRSGGCNYAYLGDYETMFDAIGSTSIQTISDNYFSFGTDWDAIVKPATTAFAQAIWANWLDSRIPDDLPNNPIFLR